MVTTGARRTAILAITLFCFSGPARAQFTTVLNIPPSPNIGNSQSIGSNTQISLSDNGSIGTFFNAGATNGSSTNIEVNVSGGTVGDSFHANAGSEVNVRDGKLGRFFRANSGSTINLSGGQISYGFDAGAGSTVNLSGGTVGELFDALSGSSFNIFGGEFRLNGAPISGTETIGSTVPFNVPAESSLTGVLMDGTPFAFWTGDFVTDRILNGSLTLHTTALPAIGSPVVTAAGSSNLFGVRQGQTLIVSNGGSVGENFNAGRGSTITVLPGATVGNNLEAVGATVRAQGGNLGTLAAFDGSVINVSAGRTGMIRAYQGSVVNFSGGHLTGGGGTPYFDHAELNFSAGTYPGPFSAADTILNFSGGMWGQASRLHATDTVLNLYGSQFRLNGVEMTGLIAGQPFIVVDRNAVLSGLFVDGKPFSLELNTNDIGGQDHLDNETVVTVTLVDRLAGDYNGDNVVDSADYIVWSKSLGAAVANGDGADGNFNGKIDAIDYDVWKMDFGRARSGSGTSLSSSIPEPDMIGMLLFLLGIFNWLVRRQS